jgi:hypothetical protein
MHIPFAALRAQHPITPLLILDHQLFESGVELVVRNAAGFKPATEKKILIFCLFESVGDAHGVLAPLLGAHRVMAHWRFWVKRYH